jgi:Domain of Unknown Function (DUF1080)
MDGSESSTHTEQGEGDSVHTVQPKRRPHVWLFLGVTILVLFLIGASLLSTFKASSSNPGNDASSMVAKVMTPTPTNTPTPTATPAQALFADNFTNNSNGWDTSSDSGYTRAVSNGMLILANTKPGTILIESLPTNALFDDFAVTVTFMLTQADPNDSTGIYVRGDSNLDHDYRIDINGDNTFDITKEYLNSNENPEASILMGPLKVAALHPVGQKNTLQIVLIGSRIVVWINNALAGSVTDSDYAKGQIALFAHDGNISSGVKVTFTNVEVDRVLNDQPD